MNGKLKSTTIATECSQSIGPTSGDTETCETSRPAEIGTSMSSVADSPVRTLATQERERESRASEVGCGLSLRESFAHYDRESSSWRTSQRCLDGELDEFSGTWPNAGTMRNGIACPLLPSVPFISGIGSFSWPTPNVPSGGRVIPDDAIWTTRACAYKRDGKKIQVGLESAVRKWPTMLTTPSADDTGHRQKPYAQGGEALSHQIGGQLNPTWVEWLMGFPLGWTDLEDSETPSSRKSQNGSAEES